MVSSTVAAERGLRTEDPVPNPTELDGVPVTTSQLQVLAMTNYGHFTTMRVEAGRVRGLTLHLRRLNRDCLEIFGVSLDAERVRHLVRKIIAGRLTPIVVRVTVFDPALELGHPGADAQPHVLVTTRPAPALPAPPQSLQLLPYVRETPHVKHVSIFGAVRQRRIAQLAGFDDAIFVGPDGTVSEASTSNIGIIDHSGVRWPDGPVLPGVTRLLLRDLATVPSTTGPVTVADLSRATAVIATNASVGVRPIALVADEDGAAVFKADRDAATNRLLDTLVAGYHAVEGEPV